MTLSVVTVNFNNKCGLLHTINSVVGQTSNDIEYIVIDGGSTDGSDQVIKEYAQYIDYYVSESDGGIYQGMNKGIKRAKGDFLLFLNSGDYLIRKDSLKEAILKLSSEDIVVFRQKYISQGRRKSISPRLYEKEVDATFFMTSVFPHQATLIRRSLFEKVGLYDVRFKIVADWAWWTEAIVRHHATFKMESTFLSIMEQGGVSKDIAKCQEEMKILMNEYLSEGLITWQDIFRISSYGRRYQFTQRNFLSKCLVKIAIWLGKRY